MLVPTHLQAEAFAAFDAFAAFAAFDAFDAFDATDAFDAFDYAVLGLGLGLWWSAPILCLA